MARRLIEMEERVWLISAGSSWSPSGVLRCVSLTHRHTKTEKLQARTTSVGYMANDLHPSLTNAHYALPIQLLAPSLCWHMTALACLKLLACLPLYATYWYSEKVHYAIVILKGKKPFLFAHLGNLSNLFMKYCYSLKHQPTPVVTSFFFLWISISKMETSFVFVLCIFQ